MVIRIIKVIRMIRVARVDIEVGSVRWQKANH